MRLVPAVLILATVTGWVGCAKQRRRPPAELPAVLEVDNQNALDMNIYVVQTSGARQRLGTAIAHTVTRFTIPSRFIFGITPLRFQADPIGGRLRPFSDEIAVEPGDTVVLRIPPG